MNRFGLNEQPDPVLDEIKQAEEERMQLKFDFEFKEDEQYLFDQEYGHIDGLGEDEIFY